MYKITSKVLGSINVNGKNIGYNGFILVSKLTSDITVLQQEGIVKVNIISDVVKPVTVKLNATTNTNNSGTTVKK